MKPARHWRWCLPWLVAVVPAEAAPAIVLEPPPFVQRVVLTDFLLVETNNDVALAPTNLLVIYFPASDHPDRVARGVGLRRNAAGKCIVTYLAAVPPGKTGDFRTEEKPLDPVIARNVLLVVRHLVETNSHPAREALYRPSGNDEAWILLRDQPTPLTGVVLSDALQVGRAEDVRVFRDVCAGLVGMLVAPREEQQDVIAQLDRFTAAYVEARNLLRR
jgi:hypothetical protein